MRSISPRILKLRKLVDGVESDAKRMKSEGKDIDKLVDKLESNVKTRAGLLTMILTIAPDLFNGDVKGCSAPDAGVCNTVV